MSKRTFLQQKNVEFSLLAILLNLIVFDIFVEDWFWPGWQRRIYLFTSTLTWTQQKPRTSNIRRRHQQSDESEKKNDLFPAPCVDDQLKSLLHQPWTSRLLCPAIPLSLSVSWMRTNRHGWRSVALSLTLSIATAIPPVPLSSDWMTERAAWTAPISNRTRTHCSRPCDWALRCKWTAHWASFAGKCSCVVTRCVAWKTSILRRSGSTEWFTAARERDKVNKPLFCCCFRDR